MTKRTLFILLAILMASAYAQASNSITPIIMFLLEESDNKLKTFLTGKLNDTGMTVAGDDQSGDGGLNLSCLANFDGPQDCSYGADSIPPKEGDLNAGFSFLFIDDFGETQEPQELASACAVVDEVTGLMWDTGRPQTGIKTADAKFFFYIPKDIAVGGTDLGFDGAGNPTWLNRGTAV